MTAGTAWARAYAPSLIVFSILVAGIPILSRADGTRGEPVVLEVGGMYDEPFLNPLPAIANEVWTHDILNRVYDTIGKALPQGDTLVPYILKGVDADDDGFFETSEQDRKSVV